MVSQAKRDANRRNAEKSTGPKSAEGKARSSRNASTHGIFCRDICLDGEDENEFAELREQFIQALAPQDIMETALVDEIVMAHWRLGRVRRAEKLMHAPEEPGDDAAQSLALLCEGEALERLSKYEQRLRNSIHRCLRDLRQLRKDREKSREEEVEPRSHENTKERGEKEFEESNWKNEPKTDVNPRGTESSRGMGASPMHPELHGRGARATIPER